MPHFDNDDTKSDDRLKQVIEVGFQFINNNWSVYYTDEKACLTVIKIYDSESYAIERIIECINCKIANIGKELTN